MKYKRFWFEFNLATKYEHVYGVRMGCGVTAYEYADAIFLLQERVFKDLPIPKIVKKIEDIDINDLEPNHVRPNIGIPSERGVWFPLGYH